MLWLDGALRADTIAPFDLADRGLLLGDGVFDTALVRGGAMVWRDAHVARLASACETLGFALDRAEVDRAITALTGAMPEGALRITVTRGSGPRGLVPPSAPLPRVFASIAPPRPGVAFAPLALHVSRIRRNETSPTAGLKTLGYVDAILASREAALAGHDDAVFLNTRGQVACATAGNILAIVGDHLVTPPLADGVVPGIARATLLALASSVGLDPLETSLTPNDLASADAVVVTNSLKLLAPVIRFEGEARLGHDNARVVGLMAGLRRAVEAHRPSRPLASSGPPT